MNRIVVSLCIFSSQPVMLWAGAQDEGPPSVEAAATPADAQEGSASGASQPGDDEFPRFSDTVEVTTSRRDSSILLAPVSVTVLPTAQIEASAATHYQLGSASRRESV